jgi:diguanylate cyclase (GGDEF)-like protein/PAS domain S-box-containing protein
MSTDDTDNQVNQLREAAEAQLGNVPQHEFAARPAEKLLYELQVHQIELEMQNEALRQAQLAQEKQNETLHQAQLALADSLDRYVDLYEFAPVGYLTLTPDGIISEINLTATTLLGRERKNLLNRNLRTFFMPEDQNRWDRHLLTVKKQDAQGRVELAMQRGDGAMFHAQLDCLTIKSMVRITLLDITRRKLAEDELRIAAVAFASQNGIMITDPKAVIQRVNPAFTQLTGYSAEEVVGKTPAMLHSGRQGQLFYLEMNVALKEKGYWKGEIWNRRKNGNVYAELLTITAIYSPDKSITHFVGSFTDITDIKEAEAEIHQLAYYDPLTKLPNRRLLQDRLKQSIAATARSKMYGALFFIDLDRFKALNDTRGHDVGDLLLIDVAQRLLEAVRENDTVARQGGDEFVVLMEELGATANEAAVLAEQLGNKVHAALDTPFNLNGYEYHCMSSIGVDLFHAHDTVEALFKHADLALYQAKNSGRDKLRFFNPTLQDAIDQRSILESALQKVLPLNQLRLYYQPQLDASRRVVGVEALLRWQHPQRGLVAPDDFIPLAEDTGLILPIGRWVMETACAQIKAWENDAHTRELQIAVNVSARQFRQPDFVTQVKNVLADSGANPACLKLELTESMLLEDVKDTIAKMQAIKQLGVCFSMDDFGTGYSSLSYLAQLPLDQLKVDKAFVRNLPGVTKDETIARAIVTMGLGLNMNVIAEGVETESQREFLAALGCHEYQGYLFSRPLTIEALEIFLQRE